MSLILLKDGLNVESKSDVIRMIKKLFFFQRENCSDMKYNNREGHVVIIYYWTRYDLSCWIYINGKETIWKPLFTYDIRIESFFFEMKVYRQILLLFLPFLVDWLSPSPGIWSRMKKVRMCLVKHNIMIKYWRKRTVNCIQFVSLYQQYICI